MNAELAFAGLMKQMRKYSMIQLGDFRKVMSPTTSVAADGVCRSEVDSHYISLIVCEWHCFIHTLLFSRQVEFAQF